MTDIALFKSTATARKRMIVFENPAFVSGPELAGQRLVHLLLREYDAKFDRGTNLMTRLRSGMGSVPATAAMVQLAVAKATLQMPKGDDNETVKTVEVLSVTRSLDKLSISLRLTTVSGGATTTTATVGVA